MALFLINAPDSALRNYSWHCPGNQIGAGDQTWVEYLQGKYYLWYYPPPPLQKNSEIHSLRRVSEYIIPKQKPGPISIKKNDTNKIKRFLPVATSVFSQIIVKKIGYLVQPSIHSHLTDHSPIIFYLILFICHASTRHAKSLIWLILSV